VASNVKFGELERSEEEELCKPLVEVQGRKEVFFCYFSLLFSIVI
jgi:hypothetical protein